MKARGPALASWARAYLRERLGGPRALRLEAEWASEPAATFVTLRWHADGELQGCIGSLNAARSIADDVASHVVSAALHDPRAADLSLAQVDDLDLEISLLSPLEPIAFTDEASALAAIRVGVDGILLVASGRRATLLPVMWEHLPDVAQFIGALKHKAGLPRGFWSPNVQLWRYTTDRYVDPAPARAR
ncbi:MAG: AmmeMemoRadiSam system protein A [Acidobacteriota bacterium]